MAKFLVLHGPNLNLLGQREPEVYGTTTLEEINTSIRMRAESNGHQVTCLQSNAEHDLVNSIQAASQDKTDYAPQNYICHKIWTYWRAWRKSLFYLYDIGRAL